MIHANISLVSYMDLPGIDYGDYSGAWWVFWQAPYVFVAGVGSGLYVVDATDPANPSLLAQVPTSQIGGLSPGTVFAVGNLLILMQLEGGTYVTMDISDPANPTLIQNFTGRNGYSHIFAAGKILSSGGNGDPKKMYVHNVSSEGLISFVGEAGSDLGNGGYGSYQDGMFHSGFSSKYAKFDIASLTLVGEGSSGLTGRDEDFGQVLGNLAFVGDDHGVGSALIVHQTAPDTTGPEVHWVHPQDGALNQALTTRVGLSMSDNIDLDSVNSSTFVVRPIGGNPLPGKYSLQMGLVNFSPASPLQPNTTYEVEVSGMRDLVGNAGGTFTSQFSTGDTLSEGPPTCSLDVLPAVQVNLTANFDVATVSGSTPLTYSWNFGDGSPSTIFSSQSDATHSYAASGRYSVTLTVENAFGSSICSVIQIIHNPLTSNPPVSTGPITHNGTHSFNVNPDNNTVTAIEENSLTKVWEMPVGKNPRTLALGPAGNIWVVNQDDAAISILSPTDGSQINLIPLSYASRPYGVVFSPDGSAAYVTLQGTGRLLKLDPAGNIVGDIPIGPKPRGIAVSGDSDRILVTRFISPGDHAEVKEVFAGTFSVLSTINLAFDAGPDTELSGRGVPNYLTSIRISPDGLHAFILSKKDNVARGLFRDGEPLTFESRVRTIVSQIDLQTSSESLSARMDLNDRDMAQSVIFSPVGDIFFVATQGSDRVEVYDTNTQAFLGGLNTGSSPQGLSFNNDASKLYVHNFLSRSVSVFDTSGFIHGTTNSAEMLAEVITVTNETLSPELLEGKRIFYNASDPRMSQDGYISCASCHLDGGSDGQVWDFTQVGEGLRNTITLRGRAGTGHGNVHWTANFDEIQDFENDIRGGFGGIGFMSDSDFADTSDPLGSPKTGLSVALDALSAHVSSLVSTPPSPHRNSDGSLTPEGQAGKQIFLAKNCDACHSGASFTDNQRHDVGTIQLSSGTGIGQPLAGIGFDTPTLKGIWNTSPYFHNGQAATLLDTVTIPVHGDTTGLTNNDIQALVSYLQQIDDNEPAP